MDPSSSSNGTLEPEVAGILTKTVIRSPVVRWILHARIRHRRFNDAVFVGDDFIHVKQVREGGNLEHVATKSDFDARIRAAKILTHESEPQDEDFLIKQEDDLVTSTVSPPESLVLTLDSHELLFVWLIHDKADTYRFVQHAVPIPAFDRVLYQPGEHLAVDPYSRAIAAAANEREVVIYSVKPRGQIMHGKSADNRDSSPILAQRPLQIEGTIQHMDFLIPPSDDQDRIILLLIVADQRRVRAVWIDWHVGDSLHEAQIHPGQPLESAKSVPNLLIPLRNAAFFLIHGTELKRWTGILSGLATGTVITELDSPPLHPGASPRRPQWASWCRPRREQSRRDDVDDIYLVREDGHVYFIQVTGDIVSSHAGEFGCHVGTAFASLGYVRDPEILAVAGDMSTGRIQSIGNWFTPGSMSDSTRVDTMGMELVETIPNWASATDMVLSSFSGRSQRPRDGIFVTSGRQPYGTITELRQGLEARLSLYFELEGLQSVTNVWTLPLTTIGQVLLVLSSPAGTQLFKFSASADMESIEEVDNEGQTFDLTNRTLAAAVTSDGKLVQISQGSVCITPGLDANWEDSSRLRLTDEVSTDDRVVLGAAINPTRSIAVTAERRTWSAGIEYSLICYELQREGNTISGKESFTLAYEPLSVCILECRSGTVVFLATVDGQLNTFWIADASDDDHIALADQRPLTSSSDSEHLIDSMVVLSPSTSGHPDQHLIVWAARDGSLGTFILDMTDRIRLGDGVLIEFSLSTVKLTQPADDKSIAYAMNGTDICLLSWDGENPSSLSIRSIWVSDKMRPELPQGAVVACTHMPSAHLLASHDLAGSLVMISGDEFLVTTLERKPSAVPRQIPVSGTPSRLIYAEQQRCLVCASSRYDVRLFPSVLPHTKPEERRQIWPVIDFIPARSSEPSFTYEMQPGEKVYALLEWSFKLTEDKTYSFVLVGGSYTKGTGAVKGRITFLQPVNKNWEVTDVKEGQMTKFDEPVYALALWDDITYIACIGQSVIACRFSLQNRKWAQICQPFKLASPGIAITKDRRDSRFYVSTNEDSFLTLDLVHNDQRRRDSDLGYKLVPIDMAPRAANLMSHICPVMHCGEDGISVDLPLALASTKHAQLIGVQPRVHHPRDSAHSFSSTLLFEAQMSRSLTRIRQGHIRPRWKGAPPKGVVVDNVIGCASDGTLVGIALVNRDLWRRLSWLQRLCEWSEDLSPHSHRRPLYSVTEQNFARNERGMPIGLATESGTRSEIVMRTSRSKLHDRHIDGDILERLLHRGGAETLKDIVGAVAERKDPVGEWVRRNLDEEIAAVDEIVAMVRALLDRWI